MTLTAQSAYQWQRRRPIVLLGMGDTANAALHRSGLGLCVRP